MSLTDFTPHDTTIELPDGKQTSFARLLYIDKDNLAGEFASHAAWLGYIGVLCAEADADYEKTKLEAETLYAETDTKVRLELNAKHVKFTEAMVAAKILLNDAYIEALEAKVTAYGAYKTLRALEVAMKEKGSMLVSLGATIRQEMDMTGLNMRFNRD